MPRIEYAALLSDIKKNQISGAYFFYGSEQYILSRCLEKLLTASVKTMQQFNLVRFEAEKSAVSIDKIEDAAEALPVMAPRKVVVVHDLNPENLTADDNKRLAKLVETLPETTILIFYISGFEVSLKEQKKIASFAKMMEKKGTVVEFKPADRSRIAKTLIDAAAKQQCFLSRELAERIVDLSGTSLVTLLGEVDKLCAYTRRGEITAEAVDQLVIRSIDANAFDLASSIIRGNLSRAISVLDDLKFQRYEPVMILGALSSAMVDLYRAKVAASAGKRAADVVADFQYNPRVKFRVDNAFRDSAKLDLQRLRRCVEVFHKLDLQLKSMHADSYELIEIAMVDMCR